MNRTPIILSSLALLGVIILTILHFRTTKNKATAGKSAGTMPASGLHVAYIDIDSFEAHYESLKAKKAEFKAQQEAMETELQRSAQQMQADYTAMMRKQQAGTLTQAEAEAAEKRLTQMQQTLQTRKEGMSVQFQGKLEAFNEELHNQMDEFLTQYSRDKGYDYVLSYTRSNPIILYGDKKFDITDDVVKGMNERTEKTVSKDTSKIK